MGDTYRLGEPLFTGSSLRWGRWLEEAWQGAWPRGGAYFVGVENLQGVPRGQLQLDQFLIPCLDRLQKLRILNFQLLKVNIVQGLAHLLLLWFRKKSTGKVGGDVRLSKLPLAIWQDM